MLRESAFLISNLWLAALISAVSAPRPELRNFDGHRLVFTKSRFAFKPEDRAAIIAVLDRLQGVAGDSDAKTPTWLWQGVASAATPRSGESRESQTTSDSRIGGLEQVNFGTIILEERQLMLETNSVERGERGRRLIAEALGELAAPGLVSVQEAGQALDEWRARGPRSPAAEPEEDLPPEVKEQLLLELKDRHYRDWVDHALPALDDKTPRQMSRTKAGRARLLSLLKEIENSELRYARDEQIAPYDMAWMWQALGISHPDPPRQERHEQLPLELK